MLALLHSPLVGPATWQPVAEALAVRGYPTVAPPLVVRDTSPYREPLVSTAVPAIGAGSIVVVAHSGAGPLVPAIVARLGNRVAAAIFVDATLPHPGVAWVDEAPPPLVDHLAGLATDGRLPPWDTWFGDEDFADLLPDTAVREAFRRELPRLPWGFLTERTPAEQLPDRLPRAYIRLSSAYDDLAAQVEAAGWPVWRLDLHHLALLTDAGVVADAIEEMLSQLAAGPAARDATPDRRPADPSARPSA